MLNQEDKKMYQKIFSELDQDNDGKLIGEELIKGFILSGRTMERSKVLVDSIFNELKLDPNEGIDFSQFIVTCCKKGEKMTDEYLKKGFFIWDIDSKGYIDIEDIKNVLK